MRVGIDYRGAQSIGSQSRGIGRYTSDLVRGLISFAPEVEITLFHRAGVEVLDDISDACLLVPVEALAWTDGITDWWGKIPKIRSMSSLHERRFWRAIAEQKHAM